MLTLDRTPKLYPKNGETSRRGTKTVVWWELKGGQWKKRRREFSDSERANSFFEEKSELFAKHGASVGPVSYEETAQFHAAMALLPDGVSVLDAARFYCQHNPQGSTLSTDDAKAEWLDHACRSDRSLASSKGRRLRIESYLNHAAPGFVSEITTESIEGWLFRGVSPVTMRQDASVVRSFCRWLVQRKRVLKSNPVDRIELPPADDPSPETLTPDEAMRLLEVANAPRRGANMRYYFAIALLAGLRPSEILRLDATSYNESEGFLRVRKLKRGRGVRLVPVSVQLKAWLEGVSFPVPFTDSGFDSVRGRAGLLDRWQGDILRHTYISAQLAAGNSENEVAQWAGNSPRIIHTYYKGLLTPREAEAVFSILPLEVIHKR